MKIIKEPSRDKGVIPTDSPVGPLWPDLACSRRMDNVHLCTVFFL